MVGFFVEIIKIYPNQTLFFGRRIGKEKVKMEGGAR
jgi:hypothetical protein